MFLPQQDGEDAFKYMARVEDEARRVKMMVQSVRGGRFAGWKPSGAWVVVTKDEDGLEVEIVEPTPDRLVLRVAILRCASCGCHTAEHSIRELEEEELKGKRNKDRKRCGGKSPEDGNPCGCVKTPAEIVEKQSSLDWIAKRLAQRMMEREIPGWRSVNASTLWDGVHEAPKEAAP